MKQNKYIIIAFIVIAAAIAGLYLVPKHYRIVYVDNSRVFQDFIMKKELEAAYKKTENARKTQLDSMILELKMISREYESTRNSKLLGLLEIKREEVITRQKEYEEDNQALSEQYDAQIWKQLNQYIKEYGDNKGYDFIMGAQGDGTLMYAGEKNNVTEDVISFINKRYEGK